MVWKPHVTVAALVERESRFLLVEEETDVGIRYNQPAGHLERGETLVEAVVRETLEETAHVFVPAALVGVYHWHNAATDITFLRFVFAGSVSAYDAQRPLDQGIVAPRWLSLDEIRALARADRLRSPLVLACIDDWRAGQRHPLGLVRHMA